MEDLVNIFRGKLVFKSYYMGFKPCGD